MFRVSSIPCYQNIVEVDSIDYIDLNKSYLFAIDVCNQ